MKMLVRLLLLAPCTWALLSTPRHSPTRAAPIFLSKAEPDVARRNLLASSAIAAFSLIASESAVASGGATAGGAYLNRAKQRYNDRVVGGAKAFLALDPEGISKDPFFAGGDNSPAADFLAAAFLLANAFRSNSTTPPESLPTVKAFNAFKKEYEELLKSAKKKDTAVTKGHYDKATELLNAYLAKVQITL